MVTWDETRKLRGSRKNEAEQAVCVDSLAALQRADQLHVSVRAGTQPQHPPFTQDSVLTLSCICQETGMSCYHGFSEVGHCIAETACPRQTAISSLSCACYPG